MRAQREEQSPPAARVVCDFLKCVCVFVFCAGVDDVADYDPNLLSDPQWPCGKHKRVLIFASYMVRL